MSFGTDDMNTGAATKGFSGFVDVGNLDDVKEPELVPAGDYTLEIIKAEQQLSKNQDMMTHVSFKVLDSGVDNPNIIHTYMLHPNPSEEDEVNNSRKLNFKRLIESFGIELVDGRLDVNLIAGYTGQVTLGVQPAKGEYSASNRITKWHSKY